MQYHRVLSIVMVVILIGAAFWVQIGAANGDYQNAANTASMVLAGKNVARENLDELQSACGWLRRQYLAQTALSWHGLNEQQVKEACTKEVRVHGE